MKKIKKPCRSQTYDLQILSGERNALIQWTSSEELEKD